MVVGKTKAVDTRLSVDGPLYRYAALRRFIQLKHGLSQRRATELTSEREFNLNPDAEVDGDYAMRHRLLFCQAMDVSPDKTVWFEPDPEGPVLMIDRSSCGAGGRDWATRKTGVSGLFTSETDVFISTLYNDDAVVLLFDSRWYVAGLVSIDAKNRNLERLIEAVELVLAQGGHRDDLYAVISPSLGPCCYSFPDPSLPGSKNRTNLWDVVRSTLASTGLVTSRILNPRACTGCRPFDFYSRHSGGEGAGAGAITVGISDHGDFGRVLAQRRAGFMQRETGQDDEDDSLERISLSIEEQRLNKEMKCPYGHNKVYIRTLLDGRTKLDKPEIALRCPIYEHVGLAAGGYNILDKPYIERYCCGDYEQCAAYRKFMDTKRR